MQRWQGLIISDFLSNCGSIRFIAPRVGCLNFHSLLELRRGLQYGLYSNSSVHR